MLIIPQNIIDAIIAHARQDFPLALDQFKATSLDNRIPIGRKVARRGPLVRPLGIDELSALHDVARIRERRRHLPVGSASRVAARMVEVQMRVDHERDVGGGKTGGADAVFKRRRSFADGVLDAVDLVEFGRLLVSDPRIEQHQFAIVFNEETAHPHRNAITRVGRDSLLPKWLGHHAKHGAAIELLTACLDRMDAPFTECARVVQRSGKRHAISSSETGNGKARRRRSAADWPRRAAGVRKCRSSSVQVEIP